MPVDYCINCGYPNKFSIGTRRVTCYRCSKNINGVTKKSETVSGSREPLVTDPIKSDSFFEVSFDDKESNENGFFEVIESATERKQGREASVKFKKQPLEGGQRNNFNDDELDKLRTLDLPVEEIIEVSAQEVPKKRGRKSKKTLQEEKLLDLLAEGK